MSETSPTPSTSDSASPPARNASSVRLIVLLVILAIMVAAFLVDNVYMYNQVKAAEKRIQDAHTARATQSFEVGRDQHFLTREDIAEVIGFAPTDSKEVEVDERPMLKEYYRWWGPILPNRRYIEVSYRPGSEEGQWRYDSYEPANARLFGSDEEEVPVEPGPADAPTGDPSTGPGPIKPFPMPMGEGSGDTTPPMPAPSNSETEAKEASE